MFSIFILFICTQVVRATVIGKGFHSFPLVKCNHTDKGGLSGSPLSINVTVGSDQSTRFGAELDLGSYDLIFPSSSYNYNSSGYTPLNESYVGFIGAWRLGDWVEDYVSLGDGPVVKASFVLENASSDQSYTWGASIHPDKPNYIQILKSDGYIRSAAFSIWYDHSAGEGEIIFGAFDAAKFDGPLATVDVVQPEQGFWYVNYNGIITPDGVIHTANQEVLFDTGNDNIYLPTEQMQAIQASLPGSTWEGNYISYPSCDFTDDQKLGFPFGDAVVEINLRDMSYGYDGKCALLFHEGDATFGAPFVSNAFTIFDYETNTVTLANRRYSNEVDIRIIR